MPKEEGNSKLILTKNKQSRILNKVTSLVPFHMCSSHSQSKAESEFGNPSSSILIILLPMHVSINTQYALVCFLNVNKWDQQYDIHTCSLSQAVLSTATCCKCRQRKHG